MQNLVIGVEQFTEAMRDALEHISAFSLNNHQWNTAALTSVLPYEEWSKGRDKEELAKAEEVYSKFS